MKTRSRALLALLGLCASLAVIWATSLGVLRSADSPTARRDAKFAAAERLVFYRLVSGEEMRVKVPADAEELLLVTHEMLPPGTAYAPERQYQYGLKLILRAPEGVVLERSLFTRTRQSKAQPQEDGTWLQESAFTTDASAQVTDEREFLVRLPPNRPDHSVLYLRPAGAHGTLLVRVYVRAHRTLPLLASRKAAEARAEQRAERVTFQPFEKLSEQTRHWLAEEHWERLGAEGEAGTDYQIEPVYRTAFRLPLVQAAESAQERLGAGRAVALNVTGPTQVVLWLWSTALDTGVTPRPPLTVQALGTNGEARTWELPAPTSGAPTSHPLDVPPGVHTVSVMNPGVEDLRFTLEGPASAWLIQPEAHPADTAERVALLPDVRRLEAFATGPACPTLDVDVDEKMDAAGRLLRLDARVLGEAGGEASRVLVTVLDGSGRAVGQANLEVAAEPAPFESADVPQVAGRALPCTQTAPRTTDAGSGEVTDWPTPVSLPASARLFLPPGARTLRVHASRPTAVQLSSYLPSPGGLVSAAPYTDEGLTKVRWRHAPLERRSWHPLRPANLTTLLRRGARVELLSQVRLEPAVPDVPVTSTPVGTPVVVRPSGSPTTHEVLETVPPGGFDAARALSTLLEPGKSVRARFDARAPTRPEVRLSLEDATALGNEVELVLDGEPLHRWTVRSTRDRELLPPLPPGEHEVELRSSAPGLTATLNRPPLRGGGLGSRTVYRMDAGGLRVPVRKPGTAPVTLNLIVYASTPEASTEPRIAITVDGGNPSRRTGVLVPRLTRAERELPLPASERTPAVPAGRPRTRWYPRHVSVTLGEDIAPGLHQVRVVPLGGGEALWARFFVFGHAEDAPATRQWNRPGWELEDAP